MKTGNGNLDAALMVTKTIRATTGDSMRVQSRSRKQFSITTSKYPMPRYRPSDCTLVQATDNGERFGIDFY